jgi:predicted permease
MLTDLFHRLRALLRRQVVEREVDEELRFHLDRQIEKLVQQGHTPQEAERRARIGLGGFHQAREDYRDALGVRLVRDLVQDLRYTVRSLRATPSFSVAVIATLALGLGANAAVFSMVNTVLLRPLSFSEPDRLFLVRAERRKDGALDWYSYPDFLDLRSRSSALNAAAWRGPGAILSGIGEARYVQTRQASAGLFGMLGVPLHLGREFSPDEDRLGAEPATLISHELWQTDFAADPRILGARVSLDGRSHTVIGVLPPAFQLFGRVDVYTPLGQHDDIAMRGRQFRPGLWVVARLRDGFTPAEARAQLSLIGSQLADEYPDTNAGWSFTLVPLRDSVIGDADRTLLLLSGAVGLLLLIACANVSTLVMARSAARSHEFTVRAALGASRHRLGRQVLTESLAVGLLGGTVGLLAAWLTPRLLGTSLAAALPGVTSASVDGRVVAFTVGASLLAGLVLGIVLLVHLEHGAIHAVAHGTRGLSRRFRRTQATLVVAQVALAFVLLAGSALMLRTVEQLLSVDMGFDPANVTTARVAFSPELTSDPARLRLAWTEALATVSTIPGVESAALNTSLPMQGEESVQYSVDGVRTAADSVRSARVGAPTRDYWGVMRIPLIRGRLFTEQDTASSEPVAIVDEALAASAFGDQDPVGRRLELQHLGEATVVGVVRHLRYSALDEDVTGASKEQLYVPFEQLPDMFLGPMSATTRLVVRSSVAPASVREPLRRGVAAAGRTIHDVATMDEIVGASLTGRRFVLQALGLFAGLALALAAVGVAGVVSYAMSRRLREIAIRIALGATPRSILRLAMGQAGAMLVVGLGVGLGAWLLAMRAVSHWLYGVTPTDIPTLALAASLLVAVTLAATYLPAGRSLRADPSALLRN